MAFYINLNDKTEYLKQYDSYTEKLRKELQNSSSDSEKNIRESESERKKAIEAEKNLKAMQMNKLNTKLAEEERDIKARYDRALQESESRRTNRMQDALQTMEQTLKKFYEQAPSSVVTMPPYLIAPSNLYLSSVLKDAPRLEDIQAQASGRTYLPQVLAGTQTILYGDKKCVIPAYAEWQTTADKTTATTGNIIVRYNRKLSQKRAIDLTSSMINRMLMAFPAGSLHVSIIDPTSVGMQRLTKKMSGCEELYHKQVFEDGPAIDKQLAMLVDSISDIKNDFGRSISLVQHNKKAIKHGYELVVLYDPFSERPSYTNNLKKLMANGISAGIYLMIIQSELMNPDVLREFDFSSFSTAIDADEQEFMMYKGGIRWTGKEFTGDELLDCNYLPLTNDGSPLIDPLDVSREDSGLVCDFYQALSKGWQKATKSLTTISWEDWQEPYDAADMECWTKGIEVPIGVNVDTKAQMYFHVRSDSNTYAHSFVQGATGSGKSKLLSCMISGMAMKYSPKAVQMYLFDFKDGLAFQYYVGAPHVRWLVTTQADKTMFLSVLYDLEKEKERRSELFKSADALEYERYNKKMIERGKPEECIPRIMLVVDECQDIYNVRDNRALSSTQKEINRIFNELATKSRASGIHLLLSSQQIPGDMTWIGQLANNYVLNVGKVSCNAILPEDTAGKSDLIQKRILSLPKSTGAYSTVDKAYLSMYEYKGYENAGSYILSRAKKLIGDELCQFPNKIWDGTVNIPYCSVPAEWYLEFGVNTIGNHTIGTFLEDEKSLSNILLYGAQGGDRAQQLTMRTVLTTLRGAIFTRSILRDNPEEWPTIYVASAWGTTSSSTTNRWSQVKADPLGQSRKILNNLAQHGYIHMLDNNQLGEVLLQLKDQIQGQQKKSVLLYIIGGNEFEVLREGSVLSSPKEETPSTSASASAGGFRWGPTGGSTPSFSNDRQTGLDVLSMILRKGTRYDIHTILQINTRDDMEKMKIGSRDFQYIIFQQAKNFSYWPDNVMLNLDNSLEDLPIDPEKARTIFFDSNNSDKEELIIPFQLDELIEVEKRGSDVGEYIMNQTPKKG